MIVLFETELNIRELDRIASPVSPGHAAQDRSDQLNCDRNDRSGLTGDEGGIFKGLRGVSDDFAFGGLRATRIAGREREQAQRREEARRDEVLQFPTFDSSHEFHGVPRIASEPRDGPLDWRIGR